MVKIAQSAFSRFFVECCVASWCVTAPEGKRSELLITVVTNSCPRYLNGQKRFYRETEVNVNPVGIMLQTLSWPQMTKYECVAAL